MYTIHVYQGVIVGEV